MVFQFIPTREEATFISMLEAAGIDKVLGDEADGVMDAEDEVYSLATDSGED